MRIQQKCGECKKLKRMPDFQKNGAIYHPTCNQCLEEGFLQSDMTEEEQQKEIDKQEAIKKEPISNKDKKVQQIDLKTGEIMNSFDTPAKAAEAIGKSPVTIRSVLRGSQKSAFGFGWKYN